MVRTAGFAATVFVTTGFGANGFIDEGLVVVVFTVVATAVVLPFSIWDVSVHGTGAWDVTVLLKGLGIAVLVGVFA